MFDSEWQGYIKNILKNNILADVQFKYNIWVWNSKIVVIDILDIKIAYDIILDKDSIIVKIILRKDCDMSMVNKIYPLFPKDEKQKTIFITSISTIQTL